MGVITVARRVGLAAALALSCALPAAAGDWLKAESPNFTLYTDVGPDEARRYVGTLELFDFYLRASHGLKTSEPARRKLPVYLLRRNADMRRIQPALARQVEGFYASGEEDTFAVAAFERNDNAIVLHEYVHHFMHQHFPYGYPGWLVEGYAEYFMTFKHKGSGLVEVGAFHPARVFWLANESWIPFSTVLDARPFDLSTSRMQAMYYAQAWALTHYFMSDPGRRRQLDAYVRAVGARADSAEAMRTATGLPTQELGRRLKTYLDGGLPYHRARVNTFETPAITMSPLSRAAGDVLLTGLRVKMDNGEDADFDKTDGPVLLADARRVAGPHAGDRLADLALARAEMKLGDLAVAERLLQGRLAADPEDAEVLQVLAYARLEAAERTTDPARADALRAEARGFAGRAYKLDPDSYQTLLAYAAARESLKSYPTENDLNVLVVALALAPQVDSLRLKTARALAHHGRAAKAIDVLGPLVFDPHAGEEWAEARTLLAELEKQAAAAPASAEAAGQ